LSAWRAALSRRARSLGVRLLLVNVVVVLVPWAGLEYARWHERRLLTMLEAGMHDQAALVRAVAESGLAEGAPLPLELLRTTLHRAAVDTRTRVRILDEAGVALVDSHDLGPPEGPEPPVSSWLGSSSSTASRVTPDAAMELWPPLAARGEVRAALEGRPAVATRVRDREPQVFLFVAEPIRGDGAVRGVVYVTRSTQPVREQMRRLRGSLVKLLLVSLAITLLVTIVLAYTITRPLSRLANAARRISRGERGVPVPPEGTGEVRDLAHAVGTLVKEQEQRLRYISEFTADVAHELKSPLTSIRGAAELLRDGVDDAGRRARFLENIELDAERLDRLVSRLLELSRIDASETPLEDVPLDAVIERVVVRTHTAEQPVQQEGARGLSVRGREQDLERALLNLVENALRFSPPGAPIRIEVMPPASPSEMVALAVVDEGPGVSAEHQDRVFMRFFTTDAEHTGTGLGLAIVRSVAERAGGTATLEPSEKGARFVIRLRAAGARSGRARAT
jgi:two-component system sensor histidine kinase ChvG